jgi:F-type H+-transporting ATPase subunit gamma
MEMIATAKMKRAQEQAISGRPYSEKITQLIVDLAAIQGPGHVLHPLMQQRDIKKIAIIHITSDKGMCGGLNANVNRLTGSFILSQQVPVSLITVGKKGRDFMVRSRREVRAEFTKIGERPKLFDILPISKIVTDDYAEGIVDMVYIAYSKFVSTMTQQPVMDQLLPVRLPEEEKRETKICDYIFEPDPEFVLGELIPRYVDNKIYHAVLESIASEQSARMVAMRNATENAQEVMQELTLALNKARQEAITNELLDINGGLAVLQ